MMRVVLDTNVFVSALLGGKLQAVIDAWRAGDFQLIVTDEIVREYLTVLRRPRFALPPDLVDDILAYVFRRAVFLAPCSTCALLRPTPVTTSSSRQPLPATAT